MARKGLPKKYAKMGFKKGWIEYKKALRKRTSGTTTKKKTMGKSTTKTKTVVKKIYVKPPQTKGSTMKKKKKAVSKKTLGKPAPRRKRTLMMNRTFNALMKGGIAGISAILGLFIVNKTPWIRDQKPWMKSLFQAGLGVVTILFFKNPLVKISGTGLIAGGAISFAMPFMPEGIAFAGAGGRVLTRAELREMQTMGVPADIMGKPIDINEMTIMGRGSGQRSGLRSRIGKRY